MLILAMILLSVSVQWELREILQRDTASNRRQIKAAIAVFDSVATDVRDRMISDLIGFRQTLHFLRSIMAADIKPPVAPAS